MTSIERERIEALAQKAKAIRDVWLREGEEEQAVQIAANAEVKKGWEESDNWGEAEAVRTPNGFR